MQPIELLRFQNELLNEISLGRSLEGLIKVLSAWTNSPVLLTNPSYRVLACSSPETGLFLQKYLKVSPLNRDHYCLISALENRSDEGFVFPITSNHETQGFLVIFHENPLDNETRLLAEQTVLTCAIEITAQNRLLSTERQYKDAFIFDLLYGNIDSNEDIISRGELWGWKLELPHCVLVFELDDYEQYSADSELVLTLLDIIETEIARLPQSPIVFRKKAEVSVILTVNCSEAQKRKAYIDILVKRVLAAAQEKLSPRLIRVGSGRTYAKANEIFRSYQEAKVALELGRITDIRSKTPFFRDLGLTRILYNHDLQELTEFYKDTLGDLVRYDSEQNSEFLKTLEQYLLNRCDLKAAADALFLHPNTLRYRLKKIEEILEIDLNNFDAKLDLMTALKIKRIKKVQI